MTPWLEKRPPPSSSKDSNPRVGHCNAERGLLNPWASLVAQTVKKKKSASNIRDEGLIPGSERIPGEGNGILAWRTPWREEKPLALHTSCHHEGQGLV